MYLFLCAETSGGMRAQGAARGDGPSPGVHIPAADRWHGATKARDHGPRV